MAGYLDYLKDIQSDTTRQRLRSYLEHNFGPFIQKGQDVLEIGPGLGDFVRFAADRGVAAIDVIDRDDSVMEHLRATLPIRNGWVASLEDLAPLSQNLPQYDVVFMLQVMEHVDRSSLVGMLQVLYSRLKPGGKMIITVPNGGNPLSVVERYSDITHELLFSENSLRQLVQMAALPGAEVAIAGYKIPPAHLLNIARIGVQKILHLILRGILIANGGVIFSVMEPNITLRISRGRGES